MKGNGNLSGRSLKRIKGLTGFVILSYLKESTFTAVKKGCKVLNLVCERIACARLSDSSSPSAFFAFLITERLSTTISEPGTG